MCSLRRSLAVASFMLFLVVMFINFSASRPDLGIFRQSTGKISDKYSVHITPAGWTFALWGIIYLWMGVAYGYGLSQLCRRYRIEGDASLSAVCDSPCTLTTPFWLLLSVSLLVNAGWLFVWDAELLTGSAVILWLVVLVNWAMMIVLHRRMYAVRDVVFARCKCELAALLACVHNGLAIYTTWTSVAALLNTDITLVHVGQFSDEVCSNTMLVLLGLGVIVWFFVDTLLLDRYTRWTITPYFTLLWAAVGIYSKRGLNEPKSTHSLSSVLVAETTLALLIRLVVLVVYHMRYNWIKRPTKVGGMSLN